MKQSKYIYMILINLPTITIGAILPSAAKYSSALFLNLSRNNPQKLSKYFPQIRRSIKARSSLVNTQPKRIPFSLSRKTEFPTNHSTRWWHSPAKAIASAAGGLGFVYLNIYLNRQWNLLNLETFINQLQTDLTLSSFEQIQSNIKTLEYYVKIDDANISLKAKELLTKLKNLYIAKKYKEMSFADFEQNIKKSPGLILNYLKDDILSVNATNDIIIPEAIVTILTTLKNTPPANALLVALERNIKISNHTLTKDTDKFFTTSAQRNLAVYNAIKDIISPKAALDQHEQYASDWDISIPLLPF